MVIHLSILNEIMSTGSMDITESFRPEDISKTDFFDFVTTPDSIGIGINDRVASDTNGGSLDTPLQGFDQVIFNNIHLIDCLSEKKKKKKRLNRCVLFQSSGAQKKIPVVWNQQYLKI